MRDCTMILEIDNKFIYMFDSIMRIKIVNIK